MSARAGHHTASSRRLDPQPQLPTVEILLIYCFTRRSVVAEPVGRITLEDVLECGEPVVRVERVELDAANLDRELRFDPVVEQDRFERHFVAPASVAQSEMPVLRKRRLPQDTAVVGRPRLGMEAELALALEEGLAVVVDVDLLDDDAELPAFLSLRRITPDDRWPVRVLLVR